jgi:hypothetical protein
VPGIGEVAVGASGFGWKPKGTNPGDIAPAAVAGAKDPGIYMLGRDEGRVLSVGTATPGPNKLLPIEGVPT